MPSPSARAKGVDALVEHEEPHASAPLNGGAQVLHREHGLPRAGRTHDQRARAARQSTAQ